MLLHPAGVLQCGNESILVLTFISLLVQEGHLDIL